MSWMSGADIADDLWKTVVKDIPENRRQEVAREWVQYFVNRGCDSMMGTIVGEAAGLVHSDNEDEGTKWAWEF